MLLARSVCKRLVDYEEVSYSVVTTVPLYSVVVSEGSDGSIDAGTTSPRQEEDMSGEH